MFVAWLSYFTMLNCMQLKVAKDHTDSTVSYVNYSHNNMGRGLGTLLLNYTIMSVYLHEYIDLYT